MGGTPIHELMLDAQKPNGRFRWENVWRTLLRAQGTSYFRKMLFPDTPIAAGETFQAMRALSEPGDEGNAFIVAYITTRGACFLEFTKQKMRNIQKWAFTQALEYLTYEVVMSGGEDQLGYILPKIYIVDIEGVMSAAPKSTLVSSDGFRHVFPVLFDTVTPSTVIPVFSKFTPESTLREMRVGVSELQQFYENDVPTPVADELECCAAISFPKLYTSAGVPTSYVELMTVAENKIVPKVLDHPYI